ncbi:ATP-grasp domain-containing protein [Ramlibacter sp. AN1133]|uniref:ATP-grasp domain-containing protein n=1 Tax=Ramlibacter sp. AN1133 TaxID=3133429 RepID=UPI0030C2FFC3
MKIHFLLDEQAHLQPCATFVSAMAMLADRGFTVTRGIPEAALLCPDRLCVRHDLYVLESRSELALSVAAVLHDRGGQFLNPYPACALAQNRITAASRLAAAGVPVPRSWVTADFAMLCELASDRTVIVKPYRDCGGAKNVVAHGPDDLVGIPLREQPVLVQEFIERRGPDLRLQAIGELVFATERQAGGAVPVTAELHDIALRCGRVFGLSVYGIEIVQGREGPVVVDFDRAPCLAGVAQGAALLARHIENVLGGQVPLQRQPPTLHVSAGWAGLLQGAVA